MGSFNEQNGLNTSYAGVTERQGGREEREERERVRGREEAGKKLGCCEGVTILGKHYLLYIPIMVI